MSDRIDISSLTWQIVAKHLKEQLNQLRLKNDNPELSDKETNVIRGRILEIKALQALRGISLIVAATLAAELGDLRRFERPGQLMAYLGLIPSEHSSGDKVKHGAITKSGNGHVRKALVEAAQAYRLPARKSRILLKRQENVPEAIRKISWKAQCRLCSRYTRLIAKGKKANVVKTAIARELAGFSWAIAQELPLVA